MKEMSFDMSAVLFVYEMGRSGKMDKAKVLNMIVRAGQCVERNSCGEVSEKCLRAVRQPGVCEYLKSGEGKRE